MKNKWIMEIIGTKWLQWKNDYQFRYDTLEEWNMWKSELFENRMWAQMKLIISEFGGRW